MLMQAPESRGHKIIIFVFSIHAWIQYGRLCDIGDYDDFVDNGDSDSD